MFTRKSYPNFFRIVPSENAFNAPRVKLLQAFNWTRVGTLYQNEPRFALVSFFFFLFFLFSYFLIFHSPFSTRAPTRVQTLIRLHTSPLINKELGAPPRIYLIYGIVIVVGGGVFIDVYTHSGRPLAARKWGDQRDSRGKTNCWLLSRLLSRT